MDLFDQIFMFSLKTLGEEKGSFMFLRMGISFEMDQTLHDSSLDFIGVESDINFEVRIIISVMGANKRTRFMYAVEPRLCLFILRFYLPVTKAGVWFTRSSHYSSQKYCFSGN